MQPLQSSHWQIAPPITLEVKQALDAYPDYLQQILFNRGVRDAAHACRYLACEPPEHTDPFLLKGMQAAVDRLKRALAAEEPIAVYGDYDADGVTATALLVEALRAVGGNVREYIPNRFDEGYGLNIDALDELCAGGIRLIITVDCGMRSIKEADYARAHDIELIITDHHHPIDEIPHAVAVINPKQPGDAYPDKDLAGVGVAYKLVQALVAELHPANVQAEDWLDFVAIGTVTDLAPLTGENRALVRAGLLLIRAQKRQGLFSLARAAGLKPEKISASDIGYVLGPRLNAAGRIESALLAYNLLTTNELPLVGPLVQQLESKNYERQIKTRDIQARVEALMKESEDAALIFADGVDFNHGVVGLAASRLADTYYRPAIVAHRDEIKGFTRGSCRSIPGFHITDALDRCADLLERHGGHAAAAGFTVRNDRVGELKERLQAIAQEQLGDVRLIRRVLDADLEIPLQALNKDMFPWLERIQPTGYSNREPVFVSRNLNVVQARQIGRESQHLKFDVTAGGGGCIFGAIAFRQAYRYNLLQECMRHKRTIDLMYTFEPNEYNGKVYQQLNVRDIQPAGTA